MVTTRLFQAADLRALYAIEEACFEAPVRFSRALMRSLAEDVRCRTWLGIVDAVRVGFAIVGLAGQNDFSSVAGMSAAGSRETELVGPAAAYIWTIEVLPAFRRIGVARELLMRVEESAREARSAAVELHVAGTNLSALRLYEQAGYQRMSVVREYYGRGEDALLYRKWLSRG